MADNVIWSSLYLGNLADMDTDESTKTQENSKLLLRTFGEGPGNALATKIVDLHTFAGADDDVMDSDNDGTRDYIMYDLGDGRTAARIDSMALLEGTVKFYDGSTYTSRFGVIQLDNGDTFMLAFDDQPQLAAGGIDTVTFTSVVSSQYVGVRQSTKDDVDFVCFGPGTRIATPFGPKRADRLRVGDLVTTLDDGPQPIRWIARRRLKFDRPGTPHPARPVCIRKDAFGAGLPMRDLILSPNHRVLVETDPAHVLHDPLGALAPAKALTRQTGIRIAAGRRAITYFSFLLPVHAVLLAEGIAAESLFPGPEVWAMLTGPERSQWLRLAQEARVTGTPPARLMLSVREARAGFDTGTLRLPKTPPTIIGWSARGRRGRPLPAHLAPRTNGAGGALGPVAKARAHASPGTPGSSRAAPADVADLAEFEALAAVADPADLAGRARATVNPTRPRPARLATGRMRG